MLGRNVDLLRANRMMEPLRDQFMMRFYQWARVDANREHSQDFPYLGRIKSSSALRFMEYFGALSEQQKPIAMRAMVKRFHQKGATLSGDAIAPDEQTIIEGYLSWKQVRIPGTSKAAWDPCSKAERQLRELERAGSLEFKVNRGKLRGILVESLSPIIGERDQSWMAGDTWRHCLRIGDWLVLTCFDTGGRNRQLAYDHTICVREHVYLLERTSILSWLGISSQTEWDLVTNSELQDVADTLIHLCRHFLLALPDLLVGLPKPDIEV